jgi:serine/threonine-protein kinase
VIGTSIGKYRILEKLGRGGMGIVYKAVDETLNREVAIKILNPEIADDEIVKRFQAEATILARLNHPEIATIYEIDRTENELLMVMELVRGEPLDRLVANGGPMAPERAAALVSQILGALGHAHRAGIVHRDLKPSNVMVTEQGGIKIMDFGIARMAGAEHLTRDGQMMGTPAYMAPEQVTARDVDGRADLYSIGVVFYRLITGNLPFQADTAIGIVQKQLSEAPTPAQVHRADLPAWCDAVLARALAKSADDRYQTAEEFRAALLAETMAVDSDQAGTNTIVMQKSHFAMAAGLLAVVAAGVTVLAVVGLRGPMGAGRDTPVAATTPSVAATPPVVAKRRFGFTAKAVVAEGNKNREQDAQVTLSDGKMIVRQKRRLLKEVPFDTVLGLTYSNSRQPLWNSPDGVSELVHVDGGAFGFLKRGGNWIGLRTQDTSLVLRVDDDKVARVLAAIEEHAERRVERIRD